MKTGLAKQRADCVRKIRHHSESKARGAAWSKLAQSGSDRLLWPYRCVRCSGWHLTSNATAGGPPISRRSSMDFEQRALRLGEK